VIHHPVNINESRERGKELSCFKRSPGMIPIRISSE
jgi:hypothetical protein